jgi:CheY-like chemotaxis protein
MVLIALTGWGQSQDKARALSAGFDHHVTKPVEPEKLQDLLAMGRRKVAS